MINQINKEGQANKEEEEAKLFQKVSGPNFKKRIDVLNRYVRIVMEHHFFFECDIGNQIGVFYDFCVFLFDVLRQNSIRLLVEMLKSQSKSQLTESVETL